MPFSPLSWPCSNVEASIAQHDPRIVIRYAETDADVVAVHGFLCAVYGPLLQGPIDPRDSATEVWRVVNHDVALMAMRGDMLIGTLGIIKPEYWWNKKLGFLTNRWFATLPKTNAARPLLKEARGIAKASDLELHVYDEFKRRLLIFNKKKTQAPALANSPNIS